MGFYQLFSSIYEIEIKKMFQGCQGFIEKGSRILDIGCGSGIAAKTLENQFSAQVFGVDVKDMRVRQIPFLLYDGQHLPFGDNEYDVAFLAYVLHHCDNPDKVLGEAKRVAKKRIIVFEDIAEGLFSKLTSFFHQLSYASFFLKKGGKLNLKNRNEWEGFFAKAGLKIIFQKDIKQIFGWIFPQKRALFVLEKD